MVLCIFIGFSVAWSLYLPKMSWNKLDAIIQLASRQRFDLSPCSKLWIFFILNLFNLLYIFYFVSFTVLVLVAESSLAEVLRTEMASHAEYRSIPHVWWGMQPCKMLSQDRPSWSRRTDSNGRLMSRSQKSWSFFWASFSRWNTPDFLGRKK